jgi:flavin reductase (DIM6/NTAB) family NADH-FMN oxidoreductase RutF
MHAIDNKHYRTVMARFATGVTVVTYPCDGEHVGMTANAFLSVSIDPPLVLISVRRGSRCSLVVRQGTLFGVSFLTEEQQSLSAHFGGKPLHGLTVPKVYKGSTPVIADSLGYVIARVVETHEAGDHMLIIGHIEDLSLGVQKKPLVFFGGQYKHITTHDPSFVWDANDGW